MNNSNAAIDWQSIVSKRERKVTDEWIEWYRGYKKVLARLELESLPLNWCLQPDPKPVVVDFPEDATIIPFWHGEKPRRRWYQVLLDLLPWRC